MHATYRLLFFSVLFTLVGSWGCRNAVDDASSPQAAGAPQSRQESQDESPQTAPNRKESSTTNTGPDEVQVVALGTPELTAGIPGEGPLTTEQIEQWLADPQNHEPLKVQLPMGLAAGASGIVIPEDNPLTRAKIELGRQLYFDRRLSKDGSVSCADCHHPDEGFARQTQFGVGIGGQKGGRNSPVSYNRILSAAQFWDGRAASLEEQAIGPIANPIEMGNTHEEAVDTIAKIDGYRMQFEKVFGTGVTIENIGKALAAFERAIVTGPSPFDYYEPLRSMHEVYGSSFFEDLDVVKEDDPDLYEDYTRRLAASEAHPMSESARRGRELFFSQRVGCTACHVGANFSDEKYHNLGVGMDRPQPDLGRYAVTKKDEDRGAFKTPTIRNVQLTAPYMHDGSQKTLAEVVEWYDKGGHPNPQLSKNVRKLNLTEQEQADLVEFMKSCTGDFPEVEPGRLPL